MRCTRRGRSSTSGCTSSTTRKALIAAGRGPYFYLPKLESHREAKLWNDIFVYAQNALGIPQGTVRATVLIETIQAAFQMDEILYELRDHCAGLNAGRWDYIFSIVKTFRSRGRRWVLPDRKSITMTVPFMRAYTELLVQTCHKRGAHAIGGMSAFIPNRRDAEVTERALEAVAADKRREAGDGFDGTWVAHPDLIPTARAEFDAVLGDRPNQVDRLRDDVEVTAAQLLDIPSVGGEVTEAGVHDNISIAIRYIESWLRGTGAAAIDNLMEDAATAEISRSQVWQWLQREHGHRRGHAHRPDVDRAHHGGRRRRAAALRGRPVRRRDLGVPHRGARARVPDVPDGGGVRPAPVRARRGLPDRIRRSRWCEWSGRPLRHAPGSPAQRSGTRTSVPPSGVSRELIFTSDGVGTNPPANSASPWRNHGDRASSDAGA